MFGKLYTCRPQNVHIAGITLPPSAVAAADPVWSCSTRSPARALI